MANALESNGATKLEFDSQHLHQVTHLISTDTDFPAYHDAVEGFIHVVKPSWVEQSLDKGKVSNPRQFSPDPQYFFSDVVLHCAEDLPPGDKEAIIGGVHAMGGQFSGKMTKLVTHLVALTKDAPQCKLVIDKRLKCLPVLPHWFDTCLRLGKKIDCQPYIIPATGLPEFYQQHASEPTRYVEPSIDLSQSTPNPFETPNPPPPSPSKQRRSLTVFRNKRVLLHLDLGLSDHLRQSIEDIITTAQGRLVNSLVDTNMLICTYRDSKEFIDASRAGKDVGNLHWLYYLIVRNRWSDPTSRLLHYPFPKGGIPGFADLRISVSNYQGETRIWLESLVTAMGGEFSKTMAQDTTQLVTAHTHSDKCDAAREWGIDMVNHLWLEESYAKCEIQSISNERYTTWPGRSNLGEVVGQTRIDRQAIARLCCLQHEESSQANAGEEEDDLEPPPGDLRTPAAQKIQEKRVPKTPAERLGVTEVTPGSRGAKDRALSKLHEMAPDIARFEKETKRVGGVVYGGRRVTDADRINLEDKNSSSARKRSASEAEAESATVSDLEAEADDEKPVKKQKKNTSKEPILKIAASSVGDVEVWREKLKGLNLRFVDDVWKNKVDIVVVPKMVRTHKVLCALPSAPIFVNIGWLNAMAKKHARVDYQDYALKDPAGERQLDITLNTCLANARKNMAKGGMFKGWTVFATEHVTGGFETIHGVVKANGGECFQFKGRETRIPQSGDGPEFLNLISDDDGDVSMNDEDKENSTQENGKSLIYMVSVEEDNAMWKRFKTMTAEKRFRPRIVKSDWLWRVGLSQDATEWDDKWLW